MNLNARRCAVSVLTALAVTTVLAAAGAPVASRSSASEPERVGAMSTSSRVAPAGPAARESDASGITFDDYATGTAITDQYAEFGVVFTSAVFITSDSANPTSPVLAGSPRFFGPISGRFTKPGTTASATVTGFSLDVGYIDDRNSVVVRYFDTAGRQLGAYPAQAYAINTITIDYAGIASFTVETVSNEEAGFAIDNLVIRRGAKGRKPTRMASFGDSYSSGEGLTGDRGLRYDCATDLRLGNYRADTTVPYGTLFFASDCDTRTLTNKRPDDFAKRPARAYKNTCHRHARAYPNAIRSRLGIAGKDALFVACSGATTEDIRTWGQQSNPGSPVNIAGGRPQLSTAKTWARKGHPDFVTVGIGGNDAGFASILTTCMTSACTEDDAWMQDTLNTIDSAVYDKAFATLDDIRDSFGKATIAMFGYPSVIGNPATDCGGFKALGGLVRIEEPERRWLKSVVFSRLNQALREAASAAGVTFIDITNVTKGHEICSAKPWVNGLLGGAINSDSESFHPNEFAHDAIASWFMKHYTKNGKLLFFNPTPQPPIDNGIAATVYQGEIDLQSIQGGAEQACLQGCPLTIQGHGYGPGGQVDLSITRLQGGAVQRRAEPTVLDPVDVDEAGSFSTALKLPASVEPGHYVVEVGGIAPDGRDQRGAQLLKVYSTDPGPLTRPKVRGTLKTRLTKRGVIVKCATSAPHVRCATKVVLRARGKVIATGRAVRETGRNGTTTLAVKLSKRELNRVRTALKKHQTVRGRATTRARTALFVSTDRHAVRIRGGRS